MLKSDTRMWEHVDLGYDPRKDQQEGMKRDLEGKETNYGG